MKFGKKIIAVKNSSDPEWAPFWPNYKMLKVKIKEIQVERNASGSGSESASGPDTVRERVDPATIQRSVGEVAFFKALHGELRKCADFFTSVEAQYMVRRGRLREGLRQLQEELEQRDEYHTPAHSATSLQAACLSVYKELIMLENFAVMAHTAFSKILKKHDKRTLFSTREQFMRNVVNQQSFVRYPKLKQMLQDLEAMHRTVLSLHVPSAPPPPPKDQEESRRGPAGGRLATHLPGLAAAEEEEGAREEKAAVAGMVGSGSSHFPCRPFGSPSESEIELAKSMIREARSELHSELGAPSDPVSSSSSRPLSFSGSSSSALASSPESSSPHSSSFSSLLFAATSAAAVSENPGPAPVPRGDGGVGGAACAAAEPPVSGASPSEVEQASERGSKRLKSQHR